MSKLTETRSNLGYTRFLAIVDKFVINVQKLGTGKPSEVNFVEAFRFAGVDGLTRTTIDPKSETFNRSSSSKNDKQRQRTVIVDTYALLSNKLTHLKTGVQASFVVSLATTPTASLRAKIPPTQPRHEAALPTATPPMPEVSAPDSIAIQSKEASVMSKLQVPHKEATVRFTVDMAESLQHRKLSMLAAKTGRKKVDIVRMLLKEVDG
ncbi:MULTISPECIES: hypothetical protein [unclassified Microcoleus]|uniref:hypothetical protein n=1 Tax=unclassified Microcoleus TaxID=2642155 RepID=UPI002FD5B686